jgi:hypothetical protein
MLIKHLFITFSDVLMSTYQDLHFVESMGERFERYGALNHYLSSLPDIYRDFKVPNKDEFVHRSYVIIALYHFIETLYVYLRIFHVYYRQTDRQTNRRRRNYDEKEF